MANAKHADPTDARFRLIVAASRVPPVTGQSVATEMLLRALDDARIPHTTVNIGRKFYLGPPVVSRICRATRVAALPLELMLAARSGSARQELTMFYLQLGQSTEAMVRDIPMLQVALAHRWPTILHVHGGSFRRAFEAAPHLVRKASRQLLASASRIIVLADKLRGMFDGIVPDDRVVVVPNGVDEYLVQGASLERTKTRRAGGLNVLFLSNLLEQKGYVDVLVAASIAQASGRAYRFVVAGARTETTKVDPRAFIREHKLTNVSYVGHADGAQKMALLREADVLVLPSSYLEGVPIVVLEAMHYGLALVVSECGGTGEVVRDNVNGFTVPPQRPEVLVEALDRLAGEPGVLRRIAHTNVEQARTRYTEHAHRRAMLQVFADVAREHAMAENRS